MISSWRHARYKILFVYMISATMESKADLNLTDKTRTKNMEITRAKIADEIWLVVGEKKRID